MSGIIYDDNGATLKYAPSDITTLEIPSKITSIYGVRDDDYAFRKCAGTLESFTFETNPLLEGICSFAFYNCIKLKSVDLSPCTNLLSIGEKSFYGCEKVTTLLLPSKLTTIGLYAFNGISITSVSFPSSLSILKGGAFYLVKSLTSVTIPEDSKIKRLESGVFRYTAILEFFIPESVTSIDPSCLEDTKKLKNITVAKGNKKYVSVDGVLMNPEKTLIIKYPSDKCADFTVIDGVQELDRVSFSSSRLDTIHFPDSLVSIGDFCFQSSLVKEIIMPKSITKIGTSAFNGCWRLESVTISEGMTYIPSYCFSRCALKSVTIPSNVTSINNGAFSENKKLVTVILPENLEYLGGGVFTGSNNVKLDFPPESNLYIDNQYLIMDKGNTSVKQYLGIDENSVVNIPSTVITLEISSFERKSNLKEVILTDSTLQTIDNNAFSDCTNLDTIELPDTLITINDLAFSNCVKLTTITLKSNVGTLGKKAFKDCIGLTTVTMDTSVIVKVSEMCFLNCIALSHVSLPTTTLTTIEKQAFANCTSLTEITIPASISSIGQESFKDSGLTTVDFAPQATITEIHPSSFTWCLNLTTFNFPASVKTIGSYAFDHCGFTSIDLPTTIETMSSNCFSNNEKLVTFTIPSGSQLSKIEHCIFENDYLLRDIICLGSVFTVETGALLDGERTRLIAYPPASLNKFIQIPPDVRYIGESAFSNCNNLISVSIPDNSVQTIALRAFENCKNLRFINIPKCVTEVGPNVFRGCKNLVCGIPIELPKEKITELVKVAGLPKRALENCNYCYSGKQNHSSNVFSNILLYQVLILTLF